MAQVRGVGSVPLIVIIYPFINNMSCDSQLKEELAMYDAMSNRAGVTYDPYTADQKQQLKAQVLEFFTNTNADVSMGSIEPLQFLSVRHMTETLLVCRELYQEARGGRGEVKGVG